MQGSILRHLRICSHYSCNYDIGPQLIEFVAMQSFVALPCNDSSTHISVYEYGHSLSHWVTMYSHSHRKPVSYGILCSIISLTLQLLLIQGSYWAIDSNPVDDQFKKKRRNPYSPEHSFSSGSMGSPAYSLHGSAPGSQIMLHGSHPGSEMVRIHITPAPVLCYLCLCVQNLVRGGLNSRWQRMGNYVVKYIVLAALRTSYWQILSIPLCSSQSWRHSQSIEI